MFMCKEQIDSITYIEKQAEIRRKTIFKHMDTTPSYFERRSVAWTFADERSTEMNREMYHGRLLGVPNSVALNR